LHFHRPLENSLVESDISEINEADIDAWSQSFKEVVNKSGQRSGKGVLFSIYCGSWARLAISTDKHELFPLNDEKLIK